MVTRRSKAQMTHRTVRKLGKRTLDAQRLSMAAGAGQGDIDAAGSYAVVGHLSAPTAAYLQVREGQLYAEVTTEPDGDEIMARVGLDGAGLGSGGFFPIEYNCRVILHYPEGDMGTPVIVGRTNDLVCQVPTTVAGLLTSTAVGPETVGPAPYFAYRKLPVGALDARETTGADIMDHATGGSHEIKASVAAMIDAPLVHLGSGAGFLVPPVPATVGPVAPIPGTPGIPDPSRIVPIPNVAGIPGFGIVRHSDSVVGNIVSDTIFFTWVLQVQIWIVAAHALPIIGPILAGAGVIPPVIPPVQLVSAPQTSSTSVTSS